MATLPKDLTAVTTDFTPVTRVNRNSQLSELALFLEDYTAVEIVRHFCGSPIPGAPPLLDEAVFFSFDLELWCKKEQTRISAITEFGGCLLRGKDIRRRYAKQDLEGMLKASSTQHIRLLETCHLRNDLKSMINAEKHALFAHTRFLSTENTKKLVVELINGNQCEDGSMAPVILLGQSLKGDKDKMRAKEYNFDLDVDELGAVVYSIDMMTEMVKESGIRPEAPRGVSVILEAFKIERKWAHNAVNDAVHTLVPALLIGMYQEVYPLSPDDYPEDSSVGGKSIDSILDAVSAHKLSEPGPTYGLAQFCFYCEAESDHDPEDCRIRGSLPECQWCATAGGKANAKYRSKKKDHTTKRCVFKSNHKIPEFPNWATQNLSASERVMLGRALFERNANVLGNLLLKVFQSRSNDAQVNQLREELGWTKEYEDSLYQSWSEGTNGDGEHEKECEGTFEGVLQGNFGGKLEATFVGKFVGKFEGHIEPKAKNEGEEETAKQEECA